MGPAAQPTPGSGAFLDGAATTAAGNAWAVGSSNNGTTGTSLVLHWNGTTWAQEASPSPGPQTGLLAVAASAASNAWAVGRFTDNGSDVDQNLAIHCC
jgi:hypothetical protein